MAILQYVSAFFVVQDILQSENVTRTMIHQHKEKNDKADENTRVMKKLLTFCTNPYYEHVVSKSRELSSKSLQTKRI